MSPLFTRIVLFFVLISANPAYASLKYYQYDGNVPFIEMMLNMMTVMGILDKVPVNYMRDIVTSRNSNYFPANNYPGVSPYQQSLPLSYNQFNPTTNCRSILCGNHSRSINGLWVDQNGEMLGIKNQKFLWSDGNQRYLSGALRAKNGLMLANVAGFQSPLKYQYKINNGQLLMRDQNGLVKYFRRVRFNQQRMR